MDVFGTDEHDVMILRVILSLPGVVTYLVERLIITCWEFCLCQTQDDLADNDKELQDLLSMSAMTNKTKHNTVIEIR